MPHETAIDHITPHAGKAVNTTSRKTGIILHDHLLVKGGAEDVTLQLARQLPNTDLCVDFYDPGVFSALDFGKTACIELGKPSKAAGWQVLKGLRNFSSKTGFIKDYDFVLYSGGNAPVAVQNHPRGKNYLYCHNIPRFAYDLEAYWSERASLWQRPLLKILAWHTRRHYEPAIRKMDRIIANSKTVQKRVKQYLNLDSIVIYPPCNIDRFAWQGRGDYYLSCARLEPYKRVATIVQAFLKMPDKKLVVASGGRELELLKKLAENASNISFTGWLEEKKLASLVGNAIATIYIPVEEDFGISPVESMAAGKPVIGVAEGGLLETVLHEKTGYLIADSDNTVMSEHALIEAVEWMSPKRAQAMRGACEAQSKKFSAENFFSQIREVLGIDETL